VNHLVKQLQDKKDKELPLREQVEKLEVKARKEDAEKDNLSKAIVLVFFFKIPSMAECFQIHVRFCPKLNIRVFVIL
jgi:hypothetical protein